MAAVCRANPTLTFFDSVTDLFLTLPPPSRALKSTRGKLRSGLLRLFAARSRRILANGDKNKFIIWQQRGAKFQSTMPPGFSFPEAVVTIDQDFIKDILVHSLQCLRTRSKTNVDVESFLVAHVPRSSPEADIEVEPVRRRVRQTPTTVHVHIRTCEHAIRAICVFKSGR